MHVLNRLLSVIALTLAVGGSSTLYIYTRHAIRMETMQAPLMMAQRACTCQGTQLGQAGFSRVQCPIRRRLI